MSELARQLDFYAPYVPEESFSVPGEDVDPDKFKKMHRALSKNRAAQFWGVEEQWAIFNNRPYNALATRGTDTESQLLPIRYAMREISDLDSFGADIAYNTPLSTVKNGFRKVIDRRIIDTVSRKKQRRLPITYGEAHDNPAIRLSALSSLIDFGDATVEVVRSLEVWRKGHEDDIEIPDFAVADRFATFDRLLLSDMKSPYVQALGFAATAYLHRHS